MKILAGDIPEERVNRGPHDRLAALTGAVICSVLVASCSDGFRIDPDIRSFDYSPVWSPEGAAIAYVRVSESRSGPPGIYSIRPDGGGIRLVVGFNKPRIVEGLRFSPDGNKLAYVSHCQIVVVDVHTAEARAVAHGGCANYALDWSPDGHTLVYTGLAGSSGEFGLYLLDLESGSQTPLTYDDVPVDGREPRWSPSGEWIAFAKESEIAIVRPDGSELVELTKAESEGAAAAYPHWIDADHLLYWRWLSVAGRGESRILDLRTGDEWRVPAVIGPEAALSPDGRQVVEVGIYKRTTVLFVRAADDSTGATRRQLTFFRE